ncbi:hypothetical protein J2W51_002304 [Tardiphaga robiniae]|uniref:hypothetical protein n=1 Tax=Tardiphaga robiniae TaxID=943830 RepID=UPI002860A043|nr:hypothetical protein [Tardiphaga robiniae]MDR6659734.1 hypothetical protein [Tardiphaga robiniae]
MKLGILVAVMAALSVSGCQTAQPPSTASGKPEVTIHAPVAKIKALMITNALNKGLSITKDTEYLLQFDRPTQNMGAAILLGSKYDSVPNERYILTFAPAGEETRVVASAMFVTNPGSGFERITPVNAGAGIDQTQRDLDELKATAEAQSAPPPAPTTNKKPKIAAR